MANSNHAWWHGAVIYEIYIRSFFDSNGDGIGDLRGITQKLDYLASLPIDAIWITPFFRSPMKDFGYDVEDYESVAEAFGSIDDFDYLVRKAHEWMRENDFEMKPFASSRKIPSCPAHSVISRRSRASPKPQESPSWPNSRSSRSR